jgi:hypothetical protein
MRALVSLAVLASVAHADAPKGAKLALTTSTGVEVYTAKKKIVLVKGKAVEIAAPAAGTPAITEAPLVGGLVQLQLAYVEQRPKGASEAKEYVWLLRDDGSVACKLTGTSTTNPGTACGSGGTTSVAVSGKVDGGDVLVEVEVSKSGTFSEKRGGACMQRSPVRSGPRVTLYKIGPKGTCVRVASPPPMVKKEI